MGLFDKLKESFGGDDKPKSFQVTFMEQKMGMTISSGKKEEALVTGGKLLFYRSYIHSLPAFAARANAREGAACVTSRETETARRLKC